MTRQFFPLFDTDNLPYRFHERLAYGTVRDITDELPFDIPESWEWVRLGDTCSSITDGDHQPPPQVEHGIPFLVISNVSQGFFDWSNTRFVPKDYYDSIQTLRKAEVDDILFTVTGSYGIPLIVEDDRQFCFQRHIALLKPLLVNRLFLLQLLRSPCIKIQCDEKATGTAQKTVSLGTLRRLLIPLPPISEQQRIVECIKQLIPHITTYDTAEQKLTTLNATFPDHLEKSILQAAVQGKLVPQDENDEPASVLLDRIRAEREQLILDGKMKRSKNESLIIKRDNSHYEIRDGDEFCIDEELPFEIPDNWAWCRLGTLCNFGDCENVESVNIAPEAWLLDLEDIEKDSGRVHQRKRISEVKSLSTKHRFSEGQVLYSKLRPYLNKVIIADEDGYCTSEILPLDFGVAVYNRYAQVYLMSPFFVSYANQCSYGVKMPRLGTQDGRNALLPLPPTAEQHRILDRFDAIMPLLAEL